MNNPNYDKYASPMAKRNSKDPGNWIGDAMDCHGYSDWGYPKDASHEQWEAFEDFLQHTGPGQGTFKARKRE